MKKTLYLLVMLLIFSGCEAQKPDKTTPSGAFQRLSRCIDTASTECLFWELDNETRWTVSSIYKILHETRETVEKSYPKDDALRNSVYGRWKDESTAKTDVEMFDILCKRHSCLKNLAKGFGAIREIQKGNKKATVTTIREDTFVLKKSKSTWGIVLLEDVLDGERVRLSDTLKQVKRNAEDYEQQQLATGKSQERN